MHFIDELNNPQKEASTHLDGPMSIIAGAGSGKTKVLTTRIAFLLEQGIEPYHILALTFTNKAAKEMVERVSRMVGNSDARSLFIGTFHAVFARVLRIEGERLGYPRDFTIYDTDDSKSVLRTVIKNNMLDEKVYKLNIVQSRISAAKNSLISPADYKQIPELIGEDESAGLGQIAVIYEDYVEQCFKNGAMDFDDLLVKMYELLARFPDLLEKYQNKFKYIMIDEYQDTNGAQYHIIKMLAAKHQNIVVVGDDAQSIYSFRGATIKNILQFKQDYPKAMMIKLEQNYRSTKSIISAANAVIDKNTRQIKKDLWTENDQGEKIQVYKLLTDTEEAKFVASTIAEQKLRNHYANQEFAILYRTNAQSRSFEESLRRSNIPYRIYGGLSFYQRKEIKDYITYLRILVNTQDEEAIKRIINYPKRSIGDTSLQKLIISAKNENVSLWQMMQTPEKAGLPTAASLAVRNFVTMIQSVQTYLDTKNAYEVALEIGKQSSLISELKKDITPEGQSRFENVQELLNSIQEFSETPDEDGEIRQVTLGEYLQQVTLLTDADNEDENPDTVKLMTIHAAKGLEFPNVFLVGLEENLFPSQRSMFDIEDMEEERRLFYVAITRAEKQLWVSYANMRYRFGNLINNNPSRFVNELPAEHVHTNSTTSGGQSLSNSQVPDFSRSGKNLIDSIRKTQKDEYNHAVSKDFIVADPSSLELGDRVEHMKFGFGKIITIDGGENNRMASILFEKGEQVPKKIMLKFAKLQKV